MEEDSDNISTKSTKKSTMQVTTLSARAKV